MKSICQPGIKLTLTANEFRALYSLIQQVVLGAKPKGMEAVLLHGVLHGIYKKFYTKAFAVKKQNTITLTDDQTCAFCMFFLRYPMIDVPEYTVNLVHSINLSIQQKFSS